MASADGPRPRGRGSGVGYLLSPVLPNSRTAAEEGSAGMRASLNIRDSTADILMSCHRGCGFCFFLNKLLVFLFLFP